MLPRPATGCRVESSDHRSDHRPFVHRIAGLRTSFMVRRRPQIQAKVRSTTHRRGSAWNILLPKGLRTISTVMWATSLGPVDQSAGVAAVGPQQRQRRHGHLQPFQQRACAVAVLHARRGDQHQQQQAHRVDHDVALAAVDLLAGVEPAHGRADGVGALDRLGVHAAGRGHRIPALASGTRSRKASCSRSTTPSSRQRLEYQNTVAHGGK